MWWCVTAANAAGYLPGLQVGRTRSTQFCKQFVIQTAPHLAEMAFNLDLYSLW